jgi:hypothetical protein
MIKIAIDINDVIRAFTNQYALQYQRTGLDTNFNINKLVYVDDDMYSPFKFDSKEQREKFQYEDYPLEIYASANCIDKNIPGQFNVWINDIEDLEKKEDVEITVIGGDESHLSIQATLFFLSKNCCRVRNIEFPKSSEEIWKKFDVVVTADPRIINNCPPDEDKYVVQIYTSYNKATYSPCIGLCYKTFIKFLEDKDTWKNLLKLSE